MRSCIHLLQGKEKFERSLSRRNFNYCRKTHCLASDRRIISRDLVSVSPRYSGTYYNKCRKASRLLYNRMGIPPEHQDMITWPENEWKCLYALMCINDNFLSCWEHHTNGLIKGLMELLWTIMLSVCGYWCAFWIKTVLQCLFCFVSTVASENHKVHLPWF